MINNKITRTIPVINVIHLKGVNKIPNPIILCKSIKRVTIIIYPIQYLCSLHISNSIELAINKDPPKNEESIINWVIGILYPNNKNPVWIVRSRVPIGGKYLNNSINNYLYFGFIFLYIMDRGNPELYSSHSSNLFLFTQF